MRTNIVTPCGIKESAGSALVTQTGHGCADVEGGKAAEAPEFLEAGDSWFGMAAGVSTEGGRMSELDSPQMTPGEETTLRAQKAPTPAQVLLASRSPRRTMLLREAGIAHEAAHPGFDDALLVPGNVAPGAWIASLAYLKAWATWRELRRAPRGTSMPRVILGADTACLVDGDLVGTPTSAAEARAMILRMVGRDHEVITGVALIDTSSGGREVFVDRATVTMGELSEADIDGYVATGAWQGKAGAYNLSERVDAGWPMRWEGDPTTIMGLPMRALQRRFGAMLAGQLGASEVG